MHYRLVIYLLNHFISLYTARVVTDLISAVLRLLREDLEEVVNASEDMFGPVEPYNEW